MHSYTLQAEQVALEKPHPVWHEGLLSKDAGGATELDVSLRSQSDLTTLDSKSK